MKCKYCDSAVPDSYNNCPHCGAQLIKENFPERPKEPEYKESKEPSVPESKTSANNNSDNSSIDKNYLIAIGMFFSFTILVLVILILCAMATQ